jgi:hypothetical protein
MSMIVSRKGISGFLARLEYFAVHLSFQIGGIDAIIVDMK